MRPHGFTLIELLVLLAVLGVLFSVGLLNFSRWRAKSAVQQGVTEFIQAVDRTRTGAKRLNACRDLQLSARDDATALRLDTYSTTGCTGTAASSVHYPLPPGVTISLVSSNPNSMEFRPPYGTTTASPLRFEVRWAANPTIKQPLRLTGVFGKVILK